MNQQLGSYHVVAVPPVRQVLLRFLDLSAWQHWIYGLVDVDVTVVRQFMDEYEAQTGERLSFTGYLIFCLARAVDEDKTVQAYLKGRRHLVLFDDVDVGLMIERQIGATRIPLGHVIRRANQKPFRTIHQELRALQSGPPPQRTAMPAWLRVLTLLPGPLIVPFNALVRHAIRRNPARTWVAMAGTVGVTSVGMFGSSGGWGLGTPDGHTLSLIVGGIARKPGIVQDRIEPRQYLSLTVAFDHNVVDGAPAVRFTRRLVELIESGYGLSAAELGSTSDQIRAAGATADTLV